MRAGRDGGWLVSASLGLGLRIGQLGKNRGKLSRIDHTSISQEFQLGADHAERPSGHGRREVAGHFGKECVVIRGRD